MDRHKETTTMPYDGLDFTGTMVLIARNDDGLAEIEIPSRSVAALQKEAGDGRPWFDLLIERIAAMVGAEPEDATLYADAEEERRMMLHRLMLDEAERERVSAA